MLRNSFRLPYFAATAIVCACGTASTSPDKSGGGVRHPSSARYGVRQLAAALDFSGLPLLQTSFATAKQASPNQTGGKPPHFIAQPRTSPSPRPALRTAARDPFLEEVQRRSFLFFWKEAAPRTGLVKDRAGNFTPDTYDVGSIASTGFALSALPVGVQHGWVSKAAARSRALVTLRFFQTTVDRRHGLFAHFVNWQTGKRVWKCEYSSIDTALFLAGALTAGRYFGGEAETLAQSLYHAVDWNYWRPRHFICHGSRPEVGEFLGYDYGAYSECLILYVLAIGSPTHPVPASLWDDLVRNRSRYGPYTSIEGPPLFVNQYPHLWVDFKGKRDRAADYWENARINTLANRLYCINTAADHKGYGPDGWGLTACDSPDGYNAYSAPPGEAHSDGTLCPHGPGGSFMFTPGYSESALKAVKAAYGAKVWGRYGFSDSYNIDRDWYDKDVIGIDTGATLLAIENHRTGLVQGLFMSEPSTQRALQRIGFQIDPSH